MNAEPDLTNLLGMARTAQMAGNQEEALSYFNRVLESDPTITDAWIGKGKAAGWLSTLVNIRTGEALAAFGHALATAPETDKAQIALQVVNEANVLIVALYGMARRHLDEFVSLPNSWSQYLSQVSQLLDALEQVRVWLPANRDTLENIVHLCKDNIEGVSYNDPLNYNAPTTWHPSPEYEAILKHKLDFAAGMLREIDPNYEQPSIEKKSISECFVVTAAMGDTAHPTVIDLRQFRDEWLARKGWGRQIIRWYGRIGPSAAKIIAPSRTMRWLSYILIVIPLKLLAKVVMSSR